MARRPSGPARTLVVFFLGIRALSMGNYAVGGLGASVEGGLAVGQGLEDDELVLHVLVDGAAQGELVEEGLGDVA